ncbi:MAG: RrF2 family transcriptional regulator [Phycisphaerales bacterium JB039]
MYGQSTEYAIAIMTRLAEVYDNGQSRVSATDIADERELPRPFVAKILSMLAQAGLVIGARGPGGGFTLARHPREIRLREVYSLFEREDDSDVCRFGGGRCGAGNPCPLHDRLVAIQDSLDALLDTTFEGSRAAYQEKGQRPTKKRGKKKRESFRATRSRADGGK